MKEREVGPGRAGPVHVRNGFLVKNDEFLYFQKFSTIIIKDFSVLFSSPICDRRRSSLRSQLLFYHDAIDVLADNTRSKV